MAAGARRGEDLRRRHVRRRISSENSVLNSEKNSEETQRKRLRARFRPGSGLPVERDVVEKTEDKSCEIKHFAKSGGMRGCPLAPQTVLRGQPRRSPPASCSRPEFLLSYWVLLGQGSCRGPQISAGIVLNSASPRGPRRARQSDRPGPCTRGPDRRPGRRPRGHPPLRRWSTLQQLGFRAAAQPARARVHRRRDRR